MNENRIALIGIVVDDLESSSEVNEVLHTFGEIIVGRMGIPYRERGVSIISIIADAPNDTINSLAGRLGKIKGVSVKTQYAK